MPSLEQLQRLLEADPSDAFVLYALAQEHARVGDHAAAVEFYDRCLAADPMQAYACFHKARSLEFLGRLPDAVEALRDGLIRARKAGDQQALSEIQGYLDQIEG
ncbi:MAG: hypothetical protein H6811_11315 [Phycisphaeraceae bacterium]|nr:hypothetical protein [Phycisphaeraceae bacterium]